MISMTKMSGYCGAGVTGAALDCQFVLRKQSGSFHGTKLQCPNVSNAAGGELIAAAQFESMPTDCTVPVINSGWTGAHRRVLLCSRLCDQQQLQSYPIKQSPFK